MHDVYLPLFCAHYYDMGGWFVEVKAYTWATIIEKEGNSTCIDMMEVIRITCAIRIPVIHMYFLCNFAWCILTDRVIFQNPRYIHLLLLDFTEFNNRTTISLLSNPWYTSTTIIAIQPKNYAHLPDWTNYWFDYNYLSVPLQVQFSGGLFLIVVGKR